MTIKNIAIAAVALCAGCASVPEDAGRPHLFKSFGDVANTPEGLALDRDGNLYLSAINGVDPSYPGHIWKMDAKTGAWSIFFVTRTDTSSGKSFPQGIVFGDDGNLYYSENQYFADRNYASTVRRVVIENGEAKKCETVVENVMLPNGLRWRDGALWFSESFAHHGDSYGGAIYRIPAADLRADRPARLENKDEMEKDPYFIAFVPAKLVSRDGLDPLDEKLHIFTAGPDGIDFDSEGNLYTGSFGDGRFWVLRNLGDGRYSKPELLDDTSMTCCDGIVYDAKNDRIICTAAAQNKLCAWNVKKARMETVWKNADTDGADGLLDQPSELMILPDGRMVVVNIDAPSPGMLNSGADSVHTLSVIDL